METVIVEDAALDRDLFITRGSVARIKDGRDVQLRVECGTVWITQEDSTQDVVLEAGDSFSIARDGLTLVSPCGFRTLVALVSIKRRAPMKPPARNRIAERLWNWWSGPWAQTTPRWYL